MKDHKAFNVEENQTICREKWNLDDFIKNAAETAIEGRTDVSEQLGCFSTKQLALFCRCGYQKTQKTEQKVREELMRRIEIGDKILAVPFDVVTSHMEPDTPPVWRTVDARNERMVRLEGGGWYSKNNICWMEMFAKQEESYGN